jgi:hypothetical protein
VSSQAAQTARDLTSVSVRVLIQECRNLQLRGPSARCASLGMTRFTFLSVVTGAHATIHSASARKISNGGLLATPRLAMRPIITVSRLTEAAVTSKGHSDGA